jgi:acetyl-CoA C-acetyltransferase
MMPELFLAEALGCVGKPMLRVHTAGSVGGSTGIVAASLVQAGLHERVLTVCYEKQSESNAMWALSIKMPFAQAMVAGAGGFFAPLIRGYMRRSGAPEDTGIRVALKDRQNALKNPYAHLKLPDVSFEMIESSPMLWDPIRYLETCPSSDGACAMVIGSQKAAKKAPGKPAWIHATQMKTEPTMFAGRDQVMPRAGLECSSELYKKAGITHPRQEIDCAEIYVPFSWFEPMWMENLHFAPINEGWKMTYEGATAMGGDMPVNMSGGVLSSNAIGASGLIRFAEAAMQVRGQAGEHQIDGARKALGHAYGGGSQYFSMWIVGDQPLQ